MISAPIPPNEEERLNALNKLELMDSLPEEIFDGITKIAAEITGTPIALLNLVGKEYQYTKSKVGMELSRLPRELAFCSHTIAITDDILIIPDARFDKRFQGNPLTSGDSPIVFYAGVPVKDPDGHALGSLCVIDRDRRELAPSKIDALKALGKLVNAQFELIQAKKMLAEIRKG